MRVGGQLHGPAALPPGKRPGTQSIGGWVGPRVGLEGCGKSRPHQDSIPGPSSPWRVAIPTELSRPSLLYYIIIIYFRPYNGVASSEHHCFSSIV
jgi:hypothetical protein